MSSASKRIPFLFALAAGLIAAVPAIAAPVLTDVVVAADGSGAFTSVQAAIDAIPAGRGGQTATIRIKPGIYKEKIRIPRAASNLRLIGEDADATRTVLTFDMNAKTPVGDGTDRTVGTTGSASVEIAANDVDCRNLTFANSAGNVGQAVALKTTGDRQSYRNCRFIGWQDTLYVNGGRLYFADCYVDGHVDFIFGNATAVFERARVHSRQSGYLTAPSTEPGRAYGIVFLDSTFTAEDGSTYLGRPWRPAGMAAFIRCALPEQIRPEGWHNWGKVENETTARFVEYRCTGPGADRSRRVAWARELADDEAKAFTPANMLAGDDQWDPTRER